jgi:hypothetical protein
LGRTGLTNEGQETAQNNPTNKKHFIIFNDFLFTKNPQGRYLLMIPQVMSQEVI